MAQVLVRNLEARVKVGLQRRAKIHGRSMEEEVREILRDAVKDEPRAEVGLGTQIAALFSECGLDEPIPELHGYFVEPLKFEE
jgi:plasmid stability protein